MGEVYTLYRDRRYICILFEMPHRVDLYPAIIINPCLSAMHEAKEQKFCSTDNLALRLHDSQRESSG